MLFFSDSAFRHIESEHYSKLQDFLSPKNLIQSCQKVLELQKFVSDSPSSSEKTKNYDLEFFSMGNNNSTNSSNVTNTNNNNNSNTTCGNEVLAITKNNVTGFSKEIGGMMGNMLKDGNGGLIETMKGIYLRERSKSNVREKEVLALFYIIREKVGLFC